MSSDDRYRLLFELANDSICILEDGRYIDCNPKACEIYGCSRDQVIGRTPFDFSPEFQPDGRNSTEKGLEKIELALQGRPQLVEWRHTRSDGSFFDIEVSLSRLELPDKLCVQAVFHDITERKQAEEALRDSEMKLHAIFDHHYQLTGLLDCEGRLLSANKTVLEFTGINESDLIGGYLWEGPWWESAQKPEIKKLVERAGEGEFVHIETTHLAKDGSIRNFDFSLTPVKDDNGHVIYIVPEGRDITEYKRAEEDLRKKDQTVRALVESSQDWIWEIDLEGIHTYSSPAIEKILGYKPDEIVGRSSMNLIHEEDRDQIEKKLPEWIAQKEGWRDLVIRWKHRTNGYRYLESNAVPIFDTEGQLFGFRGVDRDITERREAEREREQLLEALTLINEELESIVYVSSHDLRSPLVNIQGYSEELRNSGEKIKRIINEAQEHPQLQQELLEIINSDILPSLEFVISNSEKLDKLQSNLLELCYLGRKKLVPELIDADALFREITDRMQSQIQSANATVSCESLPSCFCDKQQIYTVFAHLLDNALKYVADGQSPSVTVSGSLQESKSLYCIEDNGTGINPAYHHKIFEVFHRLDPNGPVAGVGMGLTIAKRIIERHNGRIWLESQSGQGTRFYVLLPSSAPQVPAMFINGRNSAASS
jgi:PAS domain S-box-containing protein